MNLNQNAVSENLDDAHLGQRRFRQRRQLMCCTAAIGVLLASNAQTAGAGWSDLAQTFGASKHCSPEQQASAQAMTWAKTQIADLDSTQLWDVHAHILGVGDAGSGCSIHPSMSQWWHPGEVVRKTAILSAACVPTQSQSIDRAYLDRLTALVRAMPTGAKTMLFGFDNAYDDQGNRRPDWSTFYVPNDYVLTVCRQSPDRFVPVASIHPYRADAVAQISAAIDAGAVAVKWLPSSMNIDLRDPRCAPVYQLLADRKVNLIVHCGEEKAVPGAGRDELGNPLLVRAALAAGVTVIMAHCASLGKALDLDRATPVMVPAFDLFSRMMDETKGNGASRLLGDISAVFQVNRAPLVWQTVLQRKDWHSRLLHGSDYPLPAVKLLYSIAKLQKAGLVAAEHVKPLEALQQVHPLMFDLVLKRLVRFEGAAFGGEVFMTREKMMRQS